MDGHAGVSGSAEWFLARSMTFQQTNGKAGDVPVVEGL